MIKTVIDTGITVSAAFRDRMPEDGGQRYRLDRRKSFITFAQLSNS